MGYGSVIGEQEYTTSWNHSFLLLEDSKHSSEPGTVPPLNKKPYILVEGGEEERAEETQEVEPSTTKGRGGQEEVKHSHVH